ncbi:MAG: ParB/RepB/Spo0J family partition protein [Fibrobacter sp.]|nr:ParB/RepB/Spo0J family partition protein [Fibrobacter sp.]
MSNNTRQKLMSGLQKRDSSIIVDPQLQNLGAAIRKSQDKISKDRIFEIPIDQILDNPFQYRHEDSLDNSELESLAHSIAEHGLRTPIQLRRKDDKLYLVAGWRRLTSIRRFLKSMTSVKATIDDNMDDSVHRLITIIENEQRKDFTLFERAKAYKDLIEIDGLTQEEVAKLVGSSTSRISRMLKALELPENLLSELRSAKLKGLSDGHVDELVSGYFKRQGRGEDGESWLLSTLNQIMIENLSIENIRDLNRNFVKDAKDDKARDKKPIKKWVIEGDLWKRFEVSTRNKVTLEFTLPEEIQYNDTNQIIRFIKSTLLKSMGNSSGKVSG